MSEPEFLLSEAYNGPSEFMTQYGQTLAAWGAVEHALCSLFLIALGPQRPSAAGRAFFSVTNFRDRLNLVSALVGGPKDGEEGTPLTEELTAEWERLQNAIRRASKNRNELAHLHVWRSPTYGIYGSSDIWTKPTPWPNLSEPFDKLFVTEKKLQDYRQGFNLLWRRIEKFRDDYRERRASP